MTAKKKPIRENVHMGVASMPVGVRGRVHSDGVQTRRTTFIDEPGCAPTCAAGVCIPGDQLGFPVPGIAGSGKVILAGLTIMRSTAAPVLLASSVVHTLPAQGMPLGAGLRPTRERLLVASQDLRDPNFARTVVLLVEYDDAGAMGVVVNRTTSRSLKDLQPEVKTDRTDTIYLGGPVLLSSLLVLRR
jgi:hypothetical protein